MSTTKTALRDSSKVARSQLSNKDDLSEAIRCRLERLHEYRNALNVGFYVDVRDEVRTRSLLLAELDSGVRPVFIPFCDGNMLRFVRIESMSELDVGKFGILEPRAAVRRSSERQAPISTVDLMLVPGVAFSRQGDRVGYGAGYYDRCLVAAIGTTKIGLAFDCQLVESIPTESFDVRMDFICTENELIACDGQN